MSRPRLHRAALIDLLQQRHQPTLAVEHEVRLRTGWSWVVADAQWRNAVDDRITTAALVGMLRAQKGP